MEGNIRPPLGKPKVRTRHEHNRQQEKRKRTNDDNLRHQLDPTTCGLSAFELKFVPLKLEWESRGNQQARSRPTSCAYEALIRASSIALSLAVISSSLRSVARISSRSFSDGTQIFAMFTAGI